VRLFWPPLAAFLFLLIAAPGATPSPAVGQDAQSPAYIAIGDSLAFGVGAPEPSQQGYVALAYDSLRSSDRYEERGLDLLNLSIPGATSSDLLLEGGQLDAALDEIEQRLEDDASEEDGVEMISVNIGGNDLLALAGSTSPCINDPSAEACLAFLGETLGGLQENLTATLERLRDAAPGAGIYVLNLYNPFSGTGDLREGLADLAVQQLNGVVGAVVADEALSVRMGDVYQLFRGRGEQWIAGDGLHPNEQGHQVLAEVLLATIDSREPQIPQELLDVTPAPVPDNGALPQLPESDGEDGVPTWLVVAVIPVAFAAGVLIAGGYFVARGRV
jgi:lysophospholipase L1-like esterase